MEEGESQFNLNCTDFTGSQLKAINLTRSIMALVCVLIVTLILLFLLCYKAYSTTFERLYLYVIIATLFSELIQALGIEHQFEYEKQEKVCFWLGFITHWTSIMVFIFAFGIILYLLCLIVTKIRGNICPVPSESIGKCYQVLLELSFTLLPVLLSLAFALVPYFDNNYGLAGPWCWVRSVDDQCRSVGIRDQMIYFGLYEAVGVIGLTTSLIFSIVYCKLATSFKEAKGLLKRTLILMGFQLGYILIVTFQLAVRLYTGLTGQRQHIGLWFIHAFIIPNGQPIFPLGCLACFYPVRKMLWASVLKTGCKCKDWCKSCSCRGCCKHHQTLATNSSPQLETEAATAPESNRVSFPSDTYFDVPYTNVFTNITTEHSQLIPSAVDTGYSSITA